MDRPPLPSRSPHLRVRPGEDKDLPAIRSLLHETFVAELGQYPDDGREVHQDKFEHKNRHFLAEKDGALVGMIAVHDQPPFSVAARLPEGMDFEAVSDHPLEVRLLSVTPELRRSEVAFRLMAAVFAYASRHGHRELWISGVEEQLPLYRKLGFRPLGPAVPGGDAAFTPMRVRLDALPPSLVLRAERLVADMSITSRSPRGAAQPLALLPGPARLAPATLRAAAHAAQAPAYHRSADFLHRYRRVQTELGHLMGGHAIALFPGGGTHANDVVAQALGRLPQDGRRGLILQNGEFGRRLRDHAQGAGLDHEVLDFGWGQAFELERIREHLAQKRTHWIWAVHCESSAGIRNPIEALADLLEPTRDQVALVLDAISTLGALPLPRGTAFASAVSGKALQAHPGIAIVGSAPTWLDRLEDSPWPPSMDLPVHTHSPTPPHTLGSTVLTALDASLQGPCSPRLAATREADYGVLGAWIRQNLRTLGSRVLAPETCACPVMTTFEVPPGLTTLEFLRLAQGWGYVLTGLSTYHRDRRLAQIATFGAYERAELEPLFGLWRAWKATRAGKSENLHDQR